MQDERKVDLMLFLLHAFLDWTVTVFLRSKIKL